MAREVSMTKLQDIEARARNRLLDGDAGWTEPFMDIEISVAMRSMMAVIAFAVDALQRKSHGP